MNIIQALVLGIIQGLTEFLPVSSSGHLIFIPKLLGWVDQGIAFDVVVHLGTLVAVVIFFRKRLYNILKSFFIKDESGIWNLEYGNPNSKFKIQNFKLGWLIMLTIIPAGLAGFFFNDWIETNLRATWIIGVSMIGWGVVLGIADRYQRLKIKDQRSLEKIGWKSALFIGCSQMIALIPGTSRSGITMTAGLFSKLDKKSAAEFSFLISIPIIAMAGAMELIKLIKIGLGDLSILVLIVGLLASALSGLLAIWGLMKIIQKWSFIPFVIYRVVLGVLILILLK